MFHDQARIYVEGGRGGDGCVSFRREAHVPKGGPDGGDGGRGGDVVLVCDSSRRDLSELRFAPHQRAGKGGHGQGKQRHGARGDDRILLVPPGTQAEGLEGEFFDLVEPGQRAVIAPGGSGGHGNKRFANSVRQVPRFAERGLEGASGWIELRLKLLADAGFVGLPNAGKSSLLGRMTRAAPKVADYPFTTIDPVLGTLELDERQIVLADIPGLIEGAAAGAGLGHEFLAHIERCRIILHVVEAKSFDGDDPRTAYETVRAEIAGHGAGLAELPEIVVLSKSDLLAPEDLEATLAEWGEWLRPDVLEVIPTSAATGAGLEDLRNAIDRAVPRSAVPAAPPVARPAGAGFEAEHRVYRPAARDGYEVVREREGVYRIAGRGIEVLVGRHDLGNPEALAYLEGRLRDLGVVAALDRAGFVPGDEVRIGEEEFFFHPAGG